MDMQNVSNLVIPEGEVRTIHDKNNRLLWGKTSYSVKYAGDTFQQTYSGKNLFNSYALAGKTFFPASCQMVIGSDGTITLTGNTRSNGYCRVMNTPLRDFCPKLEVGETYYLYLVGENLARNNIYLNSGGSVWDAGTSRTITQSDLDSDIVFYGGYNTTTTIKIMVTEVQDNNYEPYVGGIPAPNPDYPQAVQTVTGEQTVTVTGKNLLSDNFSDYTEGRVYTYLNDVLRNGVEARFTFFDKDTSVDISGMNIGFCNHYEGSGTLSLYRWAISNGVIQSNTTNIPVGYSQPLLNSIVIFPKTKATFDALFARYYIMVELGSTSTAYEPYQSYSYSISLGPIELCKIGDYQDYIYKSGEDWYVHKAINKVILDGSEAWNMFSGRNGTFYITKRDIMLASSTTATPNVISNYYEPKPFDSLYKMTVDYGIANHNAQYWIAIRNKDYSNVSSFKTWLASNNTTAYYVLATPTDTQIADATLVGQLNAVHQWLTRYGYNATVAGDLPIVLQRDSLQ